MKKPPPKTDAERTQTRTAKDNAYAAWVSKGKYKTLRTMMTAVHAEKFALAEVQTAAQEQGVKTA